MLCSICKVQIGSDENYTVLVCCGTRYHAGCIHRRYCSRERTCPSCKKESGFQYDIPLGSVPSVVTKTNNNSVLQSDWLKPFIFDKSSLSKK